MEVGHKVIVYTMILRGNAQNSYVGVVLEMTEIGISIETTAGKLFFPWSAVERIST